MIFFLCAQVTRSWLCLSRVPKGRNWQQWSTTVPALWCKSQSALTTPTVSPISTGNQWKTFFWVASATLFSRQNQCVCVLRSHSKVKVAARRYCVFQTDFQKHMIDYYSFSFFFLADFHSVSSSFILWWHIGVARDRYVSGDRKVGDRCYIIWPRSRQVKQIYIHTIDISLHNKCQISSIERLLTQYKPFTSFWKTILYWC